MELIGKQIDNYRVDALLGEGGMGSVYRSWDVKLARTVAVKVMHGHLARQSPFQQRFMQEARAAAGLNHPSIVSVYDFGEEDQLLYLVMEYVAGAASATISRCCKARAREPTSTRSSTC